MVADEVLESRPDAVALAPPSTSASCRLSPPLLDELWSPRQHAAPGANGWRSSGGIRLGRVVEVATPVGPADIVHDEQRQGQAPAARAASREHGVSSGSDREPVVVPVDQRGVDGGQSPEARCGSGRDGRCSGRGTAAHDRSGRTSERDRSRAPRRPGPATRAGRTVVSPRRAPISTTRFARCRDQGRLDDLVPRVETSLAGAPWVPEAKLSIPQCRNRFSARSGARHAVAAAGKLQTHEPEIGGSERPAGRSNAACCRRVGAGAGARTRCHAGRHPCAEAGASGDRPACPAAGPAPGRGDTCIRVGLRGGAAVGRVHRPATRRAGCAPRSGSGRCYRSPPAWSRGWGWSCSRLAGPRRPASAARLRVAVGLAVAWWLAAADLLGSLAHSQCPSSAPAGHHARPGRWPG